MRIRLNKPPRIFKVGRNKNIKISDCGRIKLGVDEQVTFITDSGKEFDVTAKSWGFYATPSVNARLKEEGFKTALVRNNMGRLYVMIVEKQKISTFRRYLHKESNKIIRWLDGL